MSKTVNRLEKSLYTKFRTFHRKIFRNNKNSLKSPGKLFFCDFDTGVFLTCNQISKICEKIQDAVNYLINK